MGDKPTRSTAVCYLLMALGVLSVIGLGVWVSCLASLREEMSLSQSPMVGIAPFVNVLLIFVFAWLSYAFFGAVLACKRSAEGGAPFHWRASAFWFAVALSFLATLFYMLSPAPEAEYVGLIHPLSRFTLAVN